MAFSTGLTVGYVDPVSGDDISGTGEIGTPWETIQKALDTISLGTDGSLILLQPGTHQLSAALDFSALSLTADAPLNIRGDGERVTIDGGGSYRIAQGEDYVSWGNAIFENQGINAGITLGESAVLYNCKLVKNSLLGQSNVLVTGSSCRIHECDLILDGNANYVITATGAGLRVTRSFLATTSNSGGTRYLAQLAASATLQDCILYHGGDSLQNYAVFMGNNTVADGNTIVAGHAESVAAFNLAGRSTRMVVCNNIVSGFDRVVRVDPGFSMIGAVVAGNIGHDLGTQFWNGEVDDFAIKEDNETETRAVIAADGDPEDPDNKATYYAPTTVGNIGLSTWNNRRKGAVAFPPVLTAAQPVDVGII